MHAHVAAKATKHKSIYYFVDLPRYTRLHTKHWPDCGQRLSQPKEVHIRIALHKCLAVWTETGKSPNTGTIVRGVPTKFHPLLSRALQEQEAIVGWNYAFRGYLSYSWLYLQHQEHPKSTAQGLCWQWMKYVIREIWHATVTLWKERNATLHSGSSSALEIKESSIDAKIRRLYAGKDEWNKETNLG